MMEGDGLSVVLVPQAVDYFLDLKHVFMQRFILVEATKSYVSEPCSELIDVYNGGFKFQKVRPYSNHGKIFYYPPI